VLERTPSSEGSGSRKEYTDVSLEKLREESFYLKHRPKNEEFFLYEINIFWKMEESQELLRARRHSEGFCRW